jgi:hypothetical protein
MLIRRAAKETLTAVEMMHGEQLVFKLGAWPAHRLE